MNLFKKIRKKIRLHSSYSPSIDQFILSNANELQEKSKVFPTLDNAAASLDEIQTHVKSLKNDARAIQILCNTLSFCMQLPEYRAGYISKEDSGIASRYLMKNALSNERDVEVIENKIRKIKED